MPCSLYLVINNQKHFYIFLFSPYTATSGFHVRAGRRQSIPSSNIDNCARVSEIVPLSAFGQMNRPGSSRLANRQRPSPCRVDPGNRTLNPSQNRA
jgi:hypothetical protein